MNIFIELLKVLAVLFMIVLLYAYTIALVRTIIRKIVSFFLFDSSPENKNLNETINQHRLINENRLEKHIIYTIDSNQPTSSDVMKNKGDVYERKVGQYLENKGFVVLYYGFRKGRKDGGIDLIATSLSDRKILYIQCKNWTNMKLTNQKIEDIHQKLLDNSMLIPSYEYTVNMSDEDSEIFESNYSSYGKEYFLCIPTDSIFEDEIYEYLVQHSDNYYIFSNKLKIVII